MVADLLKWGCFVTFGPPSSCQEGAESSEEEEKQKVVRNSSGCQQVPKPKPKPKLIQTNYLTNQRKLNIKW